MTYSKIAIALSTVTILASCSPKVSNNIAAGAATSDDTHATPIEATSKQSANTERTISTQSNNGAETKEIQLSTDK